MSAETDRVAYRYVIKVVEGINDYIHGGGKNMVEVFVPSIEIAFNKEGNFLTDAPRKKDYVTFSLSPEQYDTLSNYAAVLKQRDELKDKITQIAVACCGQADLPQTEF